MVIYIPKFLPFVTNGNEIKLCIHYFDLEIFSLLEDADDVLVECTRVCRRNTKFFFSGAIFCWISLLIKPFIWGGSYRLPVEVWLPFSVENQPVLYVWIGYSGIACGTVDPLIWGLACNTTAQLQILKYNLRHLDYDEDREINLCPKVTIIQKLKLCIRYHQAIASFVGQYEDCFSQVIFSQLSGSIIMIGFTFQRKFRNYDTLCICDFVSNLLLLLLRYNANNSLPVSIYMGRWYNYDHATKKALILFMERSKRPMVVTVGRLLGLTLDTFTLIIKRSYSFLALLKTYE
ncbi:odorant receptor 33b-like [Zophobas morio]|uniref:odorant receptor 33b-like n=1 Tax=Zophobas morio TaxID=2755281 RepID=UPI0030835EA5